MSAVLFQYPERARFDKELPKARLLAQAKGRRGLRERLTAEVAGLVWAYKLAPVSLNLPATPDVVEIQVFRVTLKAGVPDASDAVLRAIDAAIPSPIVFEVQSDAGLRTVAAYKRPSDADADKSVLGDYLHGDWLPADAPRQSLPVALDMGGLYRKLLRALIPLPARAGESLRDHLARLAAVRTAEREHARLQAQLDAEHQFNRKVEINRRLRLHTEQLAQLRR